MVPGTRSVKPQLQLVPEWKAGFWWVTDSLARRVLCLSSVSGSLAQSPGTHSNPGSATVNLELAY